MENIDFIDNQPIIDLIMKTNWHITIIRRRIESSKWKR